MWLCAVVVLLVEWFYYSKRIIIVRWADLTDFSSIFVGKMCVFVSRAMKIVTFLRKNAHHPKRVVDFPLERDTFRNKIMEIVKDFDEKSYHNNSKPWKSSRILRVKPNCFHFSFFFHQFSIFFIFSLSLIPPPPSFFHLPPPPSFFSSPSPALIFSFCLFFHFFIFLHFLSFSFMFVHFRSFSISFFNFLSFSDMFFHVLSLSFIFFHFLTFSFMFFHVLSCSFIFFHFLSVSFIFLHFLTFSDIFFHVLSFFFHFLSFSLSLLGAQNLIFFGLISLRFLLTVLM